LFYGIHNMRPVQIIFVFACSLCVVHSGGHVGWDMEGWNAPTTFIITSGGDGGWHGGHEDHGWQEPKSYIITRKVVPDEGGIFSRLLGKLRGRLRSRMSGGHGGGWSSEGHEGW